MTLEFSQITEVTIHKAELYSKIHWKGLANEGFRQLQQRIAINLLSFTPVVPGFRYRHLRKYSSTSIIAAGHEEDANVAPFHGRKQF
jgi:hypothetical protein